VLRWHRFGLLEMVLHTTAQRENKMAGYSGTPLPKKLGITSESVVGIIGTCPPEVEIVATNGSPGPYDVLVSFVTTEAEFVAGLRAWGDAITPSGGLWICWPKKTARKKPEFAHVDMTEDSIREHALPLGLVDNKVCAVNDDWSGLRLVWRREVRAARKTL
jgi:hypothetical protein